MSTEKKSFKIFKFSVQIINHINRNFTTKIDRQTNLDKFCAVKRVWYYTVQYRLNYIIIIVNYLQ